MELTLFFAMKLVKNIKNVLYDEMLKSEAFKPYVPRLIKKLAYRL